jgi:hypothetical protein
VARRAAHEVVHKDVHGEAAGEGDVVVEVVGEHGDLLDPEFVFFSFYDAYVGHLDVIDPVEPREAERRDLGVALAFAAAAPRMLADTVDRLRDSHGWSWADIAAVAGVTRQAAAQRWGRPAR